MSDYKYVRISDLALSYVRFSKECSSSNEIKLEKKIEKAVEATLQRMSELDVIPQKLKISQSSIIYSLSSCEVGTTIDIMFNYYNLLSKNYEKKKEIRSKLQQEHQVRKLKSNKALTLPKKCVKKTIPKPDPLFGQKVTIKAETIEELTENLRSSIWGLLHLPVSDSERITGYEIHNLRTREINGYYETEYSYNLFKEKIIEQPKSKRFEGEEK